MWERRDLQLIGVLALREIILALERERSSFGSDDREQELTAGSVCRRNCFTVKVTFSSAYSVKAAFFFCVCAVLPARGLELLWCSGV